MKMRRNCVLRGNIKHIMRMIINSNCCHGPMTEKNDQTIRHVDEKIVMIESDTLLNGAREVRIRHGESVYRLMHTKLGKLILTK